VFSQLFSAHAGLRLTIFIFTQNKGLTVKAGTTQDLQLEEVLIMKKITAFLIIACLLLSAPTLAQQITFSKRNATISDLRKVLEKQAGYTIFNHSPYQWNG
jgi:hypothetical protein